jgi:hypothetical protein
LGGVVPEEPSAADAEWPDDSDESSFLSEASARGESPRSVAAVRAPAAAGEKLPPLDELVARVPAPILGLLDDLFRAKFTGVRRYSAAEQTDRETPA